MNKFILLFLLLSSFAHATENGTVGASEAVEELANQQLARKKVIADRMIAQYYNSILSFMQNPGNFDDRLKFERFSGPLLVEENKFGVYNAGVENQVNSKPQLYIPSKLGYSIRVEAMQSLDPRPSAGNKDQVDPPSVYNIVLKALIYRLLVENEKKISHTKYFDIKGIMDISLFNTCQLPVQTSRQARQQPNEDTAASVSRLSQVENGYYDFVTYGSDAYQQYFDWLKTANSPLIDQESNQIKTLDFASYYNEFKRDPAEIKEKYFPDVPAEEYEDGGDITFGIRYERYQASQQRSELFRPVQIFNNINLLDGNFGDGEVDVDTGAISSAIGGFINSKVWFNSNPTSVTSLRTDSRGNPVDGATNSSKFYVIPKNDSNPTAPEGYTEVDLKDLKPKILGFFCQTGASSIPNTPGGATTFKQKAAQVNSELEQLAATNEAHAAGLRAGKVPEDVIAQCQDDGDDCNALLAEVRRAFCFKASYLGLVDFFSLEKADENEDLYQYFNLNDSIADKVEVIDANFPADTAMRSIAQDLSPKAVKYYGGTAIRRGITRYIFCNEGAGNWGQGIAGFSRRKDCDPSSTDISTLTSAVASVPNVSSALERGLANVTADPPTAPAGADLTLIKNHFYRVEQFSRLGIIFSFEANPGDTQPIQTSCADGIGIRFYGQEKDGEGSSTEQIDPNPFKNVQRLDEMPLGAEVDQPIPLCRELANEEGKSRNIAKSEVRHCYRLKRNLGILTNADSQD